MQGIDETQLMQWQADHVLRTYAPELILARGAMSWVWDSAGRRYLDFGTGISVCNLGHCHPRVTEAIQRQAATLVHVSNLYYNLNQPRLAALIAESSFGGRVFFCNSGAEANEGLIKVARRWGNGKGRHEVICMENSFHGRTLATLAATGRAKYRQGFEPETPGFRHVPFNDLDAVAAAITPETAAVLVEPIQGEGGVIPAAREFLQGLRELCGSEGPLLLFDEVQCGMGRTGSMFAHQSFGVEPDAMGLAKALGNGFPMGAFEVQPHLADALPPGTHASTFGGTPLACAAGIAVFETFERENVLENCRKMSALLWDALHDLASERACVREIRGAGLMIGMELETVAAKVVTAARERGLLLLTAGENVLRMMPPLTVKQEELEFAVEVLAAVLA